MGSSQVLVFMSQQKCFFRAHSLIFSIVGSLRSQEEASSVSEHQGSIFKSCSGGHCYLIEPYDIHSFSLASNNFIKIHGKRLGPVTNTVVVIINIINNLNEIYRISDIILGGKLIMLLIEGQIRYILDM